MWCWNLFGHARLNYSSGPATVVNCNLNSQLMNIQLTQQTLACFTALPLNILYPHPCLHVFMNSREKCCLLKSLVKWRLKRWEGAGGSRHCFWQPFLKELWVIRLEGAWSPSRWEAQRGQGLALRSHSRSKAQIGLGVQGWFPLPNPTQINWQSGSEDVWLWVNVGNVEEARSSLLPGLLRAMGRCCQIRYSRSG